MNRQSFSFQSEHSPKISQPWQMSESIFSGRRSMEQTTQFGRKFAVKKEHDHSIEFVNWQWRHAHKYATPTSITNNHRHVVAGTTSADAGGDSDNHVHYYEGYTTFDDGHDHHFRGWTGPPVPLPSGGHYHEFAGQTSFDDRHSHYYHGQTGRNFC